MAQVVVDCTATQMATALAAIRGRAAAMVFDDPELTQGQREVAAFLHALGCGRTTVQAVIECPVETAVDLHALSGAAVWSVDVRMPVAVALGLSDHPAVIAGLARSAPTRSARCCRPRTSSGPACTPPPARC